MSYFWTIVALLVGLGLAWRYLGSYIAAVFEGRVHFLGRLERVIYRVIGVDPEAEQSWQRYAGALIVFSGVAILITYFIERLQGHLDQSSTPRSGKSWSCVEHRGLVRDEHELAELRTGIDDVLSDRYDLARRPELRERGRRYRRRNRNDPGLFT